MPNAEEIVAAADDAAVKLDGMDEAGVQSMVESLAKSIGKATPTEILKGLCAAAGRILSSAGHNGAVVAFEEGGFAVIDVGANPAGIASVEFMHAATMDLNRFIEDNKGFTADPAALQATETEAVLRRFYSQVAAAQKLQSINEAGIAAHHAAQQPTEAEND